MAQAEDAALRAVPMPSADIEERFRGSRNAWHAEYVDWAASRRRFNTGVEFVDPELQTICKPCDGLV
jgi:hypothetical protein